MPIPSLPRFLYLDERALGEYLSIVEEGISDETRRRLSSTGPGVESPRLGEVSSGDSSAEEERIVRETSSQRFIRLVKALDIEANRWQYRDILNLADTFDDLKVMDFLHVHLEVEIPPIVQLMSQPEQFTGMLDMLDALRPLASVMGEDIKGLPGKEETKAFRNFSQVVKSDVVIVGDQEDEGPKVTGKLNKDFVRDTVEGEVFILGKVARKWTSNETHSLLALPGASLMNRAQRRQAAKQPQDDENGLVGPAVTLDILAIYR
jgi:hypothetical protein